MPCKNLLSLLVCVCVCVWLCQAVCSVLSSGADQSLQEVALPSGPRTLPAQTGPQPQGSATVHHTPAAHTQSPGGQIQTCVPISILSYSLVCPKKI